MDYMVRHWNIYSPYFKEKEFVCKCENCQRDGKAYVHIKLLDMLLQARIMANIPFVIMSACRCWNHNSRIGGVASSDHLVRLELPEALLFRSDNSAFLCRAVDIKTRNSRERYKIFMALISAGFTRFGIDRDFIHAGISLLTGVHEVGMETTPPLIPPHGGGYFTPPSLPPHYRGYLNDEVIWLY